MPSDRYLAVRKRDLQEHIARMREEKRTLRGMGANVPDHLKGIDGAIEAAEAELRGVMMMGRS